MLLLIGGAQGQTLPSAPGALGVMNMAKTYSEADILDMFGPAAPRRQVQWGTVFRFGGMVLTGATWVYGALNYLYSTLEEGLGDAYLDAEFGVGDGVQVMWAAHRMAGAQGTIDNAAYGATRQSGTGSTSTGWMTSRNMAWAMQEAQSFYSSGGGPARFVLSGWQTVSGAACPISGASSCQVQYGYIPLAERMASGVGGRPFGPIRTATTAYVDNHPLSDTVPGLYPGMSWESAAPNINQWTDTLVNPGLDSDGDRHSDGREIEAGTDPSDPSSYPEGWPDVRPDRPEPEPSPPVNPGPAPLPDLPGAPDPVAPGQPDTPERPDPGTDPVAPQPGPDPGDNPGATEPGEGSEEDTTTECWPLACEATLVALYNTAIAGNTITGDIRAELDYQTEVLLAEHAQLEYQAELLLSQLAQAEYEIVLAETLLDSVAVGNTIDQNQYDELVYQRSVILAQLEQLAYQSSVIADEFALQIFQADTQAAMLVEQRLQTDILTDVRELLRPDDDPGHYGAVSVVLPEWQPGELATASWDAVGTQLETVVGQSLATGSAKFAFLASGWVPVVSLSGGASCSGISMQILGSVQEVGVCDTPIHTVLATTARSALLALMLLAFWLGMTKWVTQT